MQSDLNCLRQNAKDYLWGTSHLSDSLNQPLLLAYCSLIFVTQGHADLSIQFKNYHLQAGDFLVLAEDSLTIIKNQSADFSCNYCIFNRHFAAEVAAVLPNALFAYLNQMPHFSPNTEQAGLIKIWQSQTDFIIKAEDEGLAFEVAKEMESNISANIFPTFDSDQRKIKVEIKENRHFNHAKVSSFNELKEMNVAL